MHALVTGGGGFLGLYIVEQLVARGDRVRVLCRGRYRRLDDLGVDCVTGDLRDPGAVSAACAGVDTIFHVAALSGIWGPWRYYHSINTLGTTSLLAAAQSAGVGRFVYTSSPSVVYDGSDHLDADERLPYARRFLCHYPRSKALAEVAVLAANGSRGLLTAALRPHLIWGPRDNHLIPRIVKRARSGQLRQVGRGANLVSVSYVENTAAAHLLAADRLEAGSPVAGEVYFVNEPVPVNLWGFLNEILRRAGLPQVTRSISRSTAIAAGALLEAAWWSFRLPGEPPMTRFLAQQLAGSHTYSISRARRDLGFEPRVSIDEGLSRLEPELARLVKGERPGP
jgi:nucleoside-diphosphate-sugar epimerase